MPARKQHTCYCAHCYRKMLTSDHGHSLREPWRPLLRAPASRSTSAPATALRTTTASTHAYHFTSTHIERGASTVARIDIALWMVSNGLPSAVSIFHYGLTLRWHPPFCTCSLIFPNVCLAFPNLRVHLLTSALRLLPIC